MSLETLSNSSVDHHGLDIARMTPGSRFVDNKVDHHPLGPQLGGHDGAVLEAVGVADLEHLLLEVYIRTLAGHEPLPIPGLSWSWRSCAGILEPDELTDWIAKCWYSESVSNKEC